MMAKSIPSLAATVAVLAVGIVAQSSPGFTVPTEEFAANNANDPGCTKVLAGCTGEFVELSHDIAGTVTVIDDCTFAVDGWDFDGLGPAVEWWAAAADGTDTVFPYPANAKFIASLTPPGAGAEDYVAGPSGGGTDSITVRLGVDDSGNQILLTPDEFNHLSVWCEEFAIDFGNAVLTCPEAPMPSTEDMPEDMGLGLAQEDVVPAAGPVGRGSVADGPEVDVVPVEEGLENGEDEMEGEMVDIAERLLPVDETEDAGSLAADTATFSSLLVGTAVAAVVAFFA